MAKKKAAFNYLSTTLCCLFALLLMSNVNPCAAASGNGGYSAPYFQADFLQTLSDWQSPLVNPALLYRVNQKRWDIIGSYQYAALDQGMGYQQMGLLWPLLRNHTVGVTLLWNNSSVAGMTMDNGRDSSTGDQFFSDVWLIGDYGVKVLPWLSVGANLKFRLEKQFTANYSVSKIPGVDLGVYVNPLDDYRDWIGDWGLSLCVQDIVPTTVDWGTVTGSSELVVTRARAGIRWAGFNDNVVSDFEIVTDNALNFLYQDIPAYARMFKSMVYDTSKKDSVLTGSAPVIPRFGWHLKALFIPQIWLKCGINNTATPYIGFDWNLIYLLPEMINYVNLDFNLGYNFLDRSGNMPDERGFTLTTKLSTDFGQTREQILSKRMYDVLILAPMDAYQEAMRLYTAGKYWDANFAFGKVLSLFPNFYLNDKAKWYLGDCYSKLYMNDIARETFKEGLEEYTTSDQRAKFIHGLQVLDYREGKYDDALKNHAFIINLYPESDIRADADYLAGEIQFQRKNYNVAEQLFSQLKTTDPLYIYAQYTLAIINIENGKDPAAIANLTTIIKDTSAVAADQLLQDAANLKLGHIYFESGDKLRQAVEAYHRVPDGSPFQDEALLGTAWSWMKVNRPEEAYQTIDRLILNCTESPLVPEAYLVKGYACMLLKKPAEAVNDLEQCIATAKRAFVTDADLQKRQEQFDQYSQKFAPTAEQIKKSALRKPTNKVAEEQASMEKEYQKYAKESHDMFFYSVLAKSHSRFFKRKEEVLADAQYALAKATNMLKSQGVINEKSKADKELDEIAKKKKELQDKIDAMNKKGADTTGAK